MSRLWILPNASSVFSSDFGLLFDSSARKRRTSNTSKRLFTLINTNIIIIRSTGRWKEYLKANVEYKYTFLEACQPVKDARRNYFGSKKVTKRLFFSAHILNFIIGEMLWAPWKLTGIRGKG